MMNVLSNKPLNYNAMRRLVLVVSIAFGLGACAHQRHTDNANDYLQEGRYELAVRDFQQALKLKPNNADNLQRLKIAQAELDRWLASVRAGAKQAYQNQQQGKALLLYGKIVQLDSDSESLWRYQQLIDQLTRQHAMKVSLQYDSMLLGANFAENLQGIQVLPGRSEMNIAFKLSNYQSSRNYVESAQSQEYLAGIETLVNPDYLHTQDHIRDNRYQLKKSKKSSKRYHAKKRSLNANIDRVQQTIGRRTRALANADPETAEYDRLERALAKALQSKAELESKREKIQLSLDKYQQRYHHAEHELEEAYERLAYLPPTVEQEVFATYAYTLGTLNQSMSVDLLIEEPGRRHTQTALFTRRDSEHSAHPTIGLSAKDAIELSAPQMRAEADRSAAALGRIYLQELREEHRHKLAQKRQRETHPREKLELGVAYLLAGDQSQDAGLESELQQHLYREYGAAGEFPIHHLLNLYKPGQ